MQMFPFCHHFGNFLAVSANLSSSKVKYCVHLNEFAKVHAGGYCRYAYKILDLIGKLGGRRTANEWAVT